MSDSVNESITRLFIDYVIVIKNFLNPKGHQNPISGSKVTAVLLKGWIWPISIGGVAFRRVCACRLRSRLVSSSSHIYKIEEKAKVIHGQFISPG